MFLCVWQLDVLDRLGGGRSQRQHRADRESLDGRIQPPHLRDLQHALAQRADTGPQQQHHVLVRRLLRSHREDPSQWERENGALGYVWIVLTITIDNAEAFSGTYFTFYSSRLEVLMCLQASAQDPNWWLYLICIHFNNPSPLKSSQVIAKKSYSLFFFPQEIFIFMSGSFVFNSVFAL